MPYTLDSCLSEIDDDDIRSIIAESDSSDDDLRYDEGWIPVRWDQSLPDTLNVFKHKRQPSLHSNASWSSKASSSLFPKGTPISTPASPVYGEYVVKCKDVFGDGRGIEETMPWLLESDIVE